MSSKSLRVLNPVPHNNVKIDGGFLGTRSETNRKETLPYQYLQCKQTGRIDTFKLNWKPGKGPEPHIFWDSDVAKWIEAAGYSLGTHKDAKLEKLVDDVIDSIESAQDKDGYLNTHFQLVEPQNRWKNLHTYHELYCAGHLMEAAVAYYNGTGKTKLLDVLCRYADYIGKVFGPGKSQKKGYPGHEEIELALVKMYKATDKKKYLDLAKFFVDQRGQLPHYFEKEAKARKEKPAQKGRGAVRFIEEGAPYEYAQAHLPVREQKTAEGHSVRAGYLYAGMADVAAETGDKELLAACKRLWKNITEKRMYVTGGIGSHRFGERFSVDYDLPNEEAYAETCAAISLLFFAHRMLQIEADSQYADVMERALYNGILSGVSLDGKKFFYVNPLAINQTSILMPQSGSKWERQAWFGCACCPPNVARLLASVGEYAYSTSQSALYVHLYMESEATSDVGGKKVKIRQITDYPWKEKVKIKVDPEKAATFSVALRIPDWCKKAQISVNGKPVNFTQMMKKGYAVIKRNWEPGDKIEMTLPMPVERVYAHPSVRHDAGRFAIQRGPIVYCLEEVDNGKNLHAIAIPAKNVLKAKTEPKTLGGFVSIVGKGQIFDGANWKGELYRQDSSPVRSIDIKAIPYSMWNNRKPGEMIVWLMER